MNLVPLGTSLYYHICAIVAIIIILNMVFRACIATRSARIGCNMFSFPSIYRKKPACMRSLPIYRWFPTYITGCLYDARYMIAYLLEDLLACSLDMQYMTYQFSMTYRTSMTYRIGRLLHACIHTYTHIYTHMYDIIFSVMFHVKHLYSAL